jgi:methionine--tRNA ligase beta chain
MTEVSFQEFENLDIRIGKVTAVEDIEGSKNLYKLEVDFGTETRIAVAGLKKHYSHTALLNKKFLFILNLERKKIMGIESECMILAAGDDGNIVLFQPDRDIIEGSKIR